MASQRGGTPFGRYVLGERLATGGMGEVYLAVQPGIGDFEKPLAIKLLLPHLSQDANAVEMFLHEANLVVRMQHPNVVQILDVGVQDGRYFIAMELVRGVTLSTLLHGLREAKAALPASLVFYLAHGLLDGLHHAHELMDGEGRPLEIVHRDISPQNLLLSMNGEVKLADFGIAKARHTRGHTQVGVLKGKMEYLAPEQFDGHGATRRSDVFAAAVTIFQLATLRSPFHRETDGATMRAVMTEPLPLLADLRPDLAGVDEALREATSKDPEQRTANAAQLRERLQASYSSSAPKELGQLIAKHCAAAVDRVEQQTAMTAQLLRQPTRQATVSRLNAPVVFWTPQRRAWVVVGAVALGGAGWWWAGGEREGAHPSTALRVNGAGNPSSAVGSGSPSVVGSGSSSVVGSGSPSVVGSGSPSVVGSGSLSKVDAGLPSKVSSAPPSKVSSAPPFGVSPVEPRAPSGPPFDKLRVNGGETPSGPPFSSTQGERGTRTKGPAKERPPKKVVAAGVGYLTVDAVPWAQVFVHSQKIGDTPLYRFPIDAGEVAVVLVNPENGKTIRRKVKVSRSREASIKEDLR